LEEPINPSVEKPQNKQPQSHTEGEQNNNFPNVRTQSIKLSPHQVEEKKKKKFC